MEWRRAPATYGRMGVTLITMITLMAVDSSQVVCRTGAANRGAASPALHAWPVRTCTSEGPSCLAGTTCAPSSHHASSHARAEPAFGWVGLSHAAATCVRLAGAAHACRLWGPCCCIPFLLAGSCSVSAARCTQQTCCTQHACRRQDGGASGPAGAGRWLHVRRQAPWHEGRRERVRGCPVVLGWQLLPSRAAQRLGVAPADG